MAETADIKTRRTDNGYIRTLNRSIASSHRVRSAALEIGYMHRGAGSPGGGEARGRADTGSLGGYDAGGFSGYDAGGLSGSGLAGSAGEGICGGVSGNCDESMNEYITARLQEGIERTGETAERAALHLYRSSAKLIRTRQLEESIRNGKFGTGSIIPGAPGSSRSTERIRKAALYIKKKAAGRTVRSMRTGHGVFTSGRAGGRGAAAGQARVRAYLSAERRRKMMIKSSQKAVRDAAKTARSSAKAMQTGGRIAGRLFTAAANAVKTIAASTKALIAAVSAGGAVTVIVVLCCVLLGAALYIFGDESSESYTPVSAEVEAYTQTIRMYCSECGIAEYTELIKAIMMQESGGKGTDPMQASECSFNTKYPKKPNGITDPEYSIMCGVRYFRQSMEQAKVSSPVDIDNIKLALQGFNFGNGYISWAVSKYGGYSPANALEFSKAQAAKQGWSSYGDPEYAAHVLRYYPYGSYSYDIEYTGAGKLGLPIKGMTSSSITSHFGSRSSPGGIGSTNHQGIDIGFSTGTHVLACESGTVTLAGVNGGYGKCIIINHGNNIKTLYGHLSKINVKRGQKVSRGQYIGEVGSTGYSTGPHLHLGVMSGGSFVNPEKGWLSIP